MDNGRDPDSHGGEWDAENDVPTVSCSRCGREWTLDSDLDVRAAGGGLIEQFALDHERHTGHYPDDITPWMVVCRRCPAGEQYLRERPARRWADTHCRHTGHVVELQPPDDDSPELIGKND